MGRFDLEKQNPSAIPRIGKFKIEPKACEHAEPESDDQLCMLGVDPNRGTCSGDKGSGAVSLQCGRYVLLAAGVQRHKRDDKVRCDPSEPTLMVDLAKNIGFLRWAWSNITSDRFPGVDSTNCGDDGAGVDETTNEMPDMPDTTVTTTDTTVTTTGEVVTTGRTTASPKTSTKDPNVFDGEDDMDETEDLDAKSSKMSNILQLVIILVFCLVAIVICFVLELHLRSSRSARSAGKRYCCHTLKIGWPLTWTKQANRAAIPPAQNKGKAAATSASRSGSNQCVNVKSGSNQCVVVEKWQQPVRRREKKATALVDAPKTGSRRETGLVDPPKTGSRRETGLVDTPKTGSRRKASSSSDKLSSSSSRRAL